MQLKLFNTLSKEKGPFRPLDPARVRMYVCGPTVYDFAHIGNARPVIVFDVLYRLLRHLAAQGVWDGGQGKTQVKYVRNITDVDDKINARAARDFPSLPLNDAIRKVTEQTTRQFHEDVAALGCLKPDEEPRATDFVAPRADGKTDMITLIKRLIERRHAYEAGGEVLFDIASMPDYGALSKRNLDEQQEGARVAVDAHKKNPGDFVLWKQSSENEPGWDSPWGRGRPGWHIECSAMSAAYLGEVFDIHGGGLDLIFPHHENEIAQSRCAHGTDRMAQVWMHNGFLQVEGEKMSKSLGNFVTIRELLADWPGQVVRFNMLRTHYRQPIDWTVKALEESAKTLDRWARLLRGQALSSADVPSRFLEILVDDLNTPRAIAELHEYSRQAAGVWFGEGAPKPPDDLDQKIKSGAAKLQGALELLGVEPTKLQTAEASKSEQAAIDSLVSDRNAARARKDWKESDRIRDALNAMGVVLKDNKDGTTTWEIAR